MHAQLGDERGARLVGAREVAQTQARGRWEVGGVGLVEPGYERLEGRRAVGERVELGEGGQGRDVGEDGDEGVEDLSELLDDVWVCTEGLEPYVRIEGLLQDFELSAGQQVRLELLVGEVGERDGADSRPFFQVGTVLVGVGDQVQEHGGGDDVGDFWFGVWCVLVRHEL